MRGTQRKQPHWHTQTHKHTPNSLRASHDNVLWKVLTIYPQHISWYGADGIKYVSIYIYKKIHIFSLQCCWWFRRGALIRPPLITIIGHSVPGEWTRPRAVNLLLLFFQISPQGFSLVVQKQQSFLHQTACLSLRPLMTCQKWHRYLSDIWTPSTPRPHTRTHLFFAENYFLCCGLMLFRTITFLSGKHIFRGYWGCLLVKNNIEINKDNKQWCFFVHLALWSPWQSSQAFVSSLVDSCGWTVKAPFHKAKKKNGSRDFATTAEKCDQHNNSQVATMWCAQLNLVSLLESVRACCIIFQVCVVNTSNLDLSLSSWVVCFYLIIFINSVNIHPSSKQEAGPDVQELRHFERDLFIYLFYLHSLCEGYQSSLIECFCSGP